MALKNGVRNIQAAAYNDVRTVDKASHSGVKNILKSHLTLKISSIKQEGLGNFSLGN